MKSISLAELTQLKEGFDLEAKQATGREGRGELPVSFFESYSAMANTDGGVVLLGVKEKGHVFEVIGVPDVERVHRALWDGLNNRERVSANLLSNASVELLKIEGKNVIEVRVPRATRQQRPVFVGKNPLGGTFIRNHEGDYRCPDEVVTRMLADKVEESRDSRILYHHDFDDLDVTSFSRYRNHFKSKKPDHPWNGEDDREFLRLIGGWRRERETKKAGLTAAGLLMFGRYPEIREVFPFFMLDYQERPEARADSRWVDRVTPDGTWSGNLFDFYQIVIQRLVRDLKVPFRLTGDTRVDESPVHEALREALVNTLIHADYSGRASVLVVKRPDMFGFRNPGTLRLPVELAIQGGHTDCRNRLLQGMFRHVGLGEQAGSGLVRIYSAWRQQHWRAPELEERVFPLEQTLCQMRTVSLLPPEVVAEMEQRFGATFSHLTEVQKLALTTVAVEGKVTHGRLHEMTSAHPRDVTLALASLVQRRMLESSGAHKATCYFFPDEPPAEEPGLAFLGASATPQVAPAGDTPPGAGNDATSSEHSRPSSEHNGLSSEHNGLSSEHNDSVLSAEASALEAIAAPLQQKRRVSPDVMRATLLRLCQGRSLTLAQLAKLTGRSPTTLRTHYLSALVEEGKMALRYPGNPTHPDQGYTTAEKPPAE